MILAGDVGGTHTRLAFFEKGKRVGDEVKFESRKYQSLTQIVREFIGKERVKKACFGIAGPVREGKCKATNLAWVIDSKEMSRNLKIPTVTLLNDLEANAYGLRMVKKDELFLLHKGKKQEGNRAFISAGTGLGEAGLFWDGKEHRPFACEGGHTDFAPRNELEVELFFYLQKKFGHVSYERVVSGPGIVNLFEFLIETGREKISAKVKGEMKRQHPSTVITRLGRQRQDAACVHTLAWFISLYGAEAGNLALKFLSFGGLYIGGGIAPHLAEEMKEGFYEAFIDKGRFKHLLETVPIWLVMNDNAALLGAAYYAGAK
jgi:glucokinase